MESNWNPIFTGCAPDVELARLLVAAPAAASGLSCYGRNRQEGNRVFWNGVNKQSVWRSVKQTESDTLCKCASEYLTWWFTVSNGDKGTVG